ncbi:MAG: HAD-IIIC family phosphatase [Candidatus Tectimicrobiota bacterium]
MAYEQDFRQLSAQYVAQGQWQQAYGALVDLWHQQPSLATANYLLASYARLQPHLTLTPCRLALLRSFTVEPLVPLLQAAAFVHGIALEVQVGDFNTYAQDILNPASALYRFAPDVVLLAVQTRDLVPELWSGYTALDAEAREAAIRRSIDSLHTYMTTLRSRSQAHLIVHTLETPLLPSQGVFDQQSNTGQVGAIQEINSTVRQLAQQQRGVYVLDYDALVARYGRQHWHDERKWLTTRLPISTDHLVPMVQEWLRFIVPLSGRVCKALVVDLDNTLWGGVIGEDGMEGIQLGSEYPGAAYQALQRAILDLYQRGIILAACSKNNFDDAMEALESHPGMLLRPQHFAAWRLNWQDKVQNLREIAAELNIGIEALAFLDDNPVERSHIRIDLPEVTVVPLPADSMGYAAALRAAPVFERLVLSDEDRERGRYYAEQRQRVELEQRATSLEEFYASLQQEVEILPVDTASLTRVAQLTQKTNQFNTTTHRYSEQQISSMAESPEWDVYAVRVRDRFGDNGIVGVVIVHDRDEVSDIDTFLLSCRVISRGVETSILSFLSERARARQLRQMQGWFLPTKKNIPARDCYAEHHMQAVAQQDGATLWALDLATQDIACPPWIRLTACEGVLSS